MYLGRACIRTRLRIDVNRFPFSTYFDDVDRAVIQCRLLREMLGIQLKTFGFNLEVGRGVSVLGPIEGANDFVACFH